MRLRGFLVAVAFAAAGTAQAIGPADAYTFGQLVSATKAPATAVLSSVELPAEPAPQIAQWHSVVHRAARGRHLGNCLSDARQCPGSNGLAWRAMMREARNLDRFAQAQAVNRFFNQLAYRLDSQEYGRSDYWASPTELLARGAGDCEDYAVAKFFSLKLLGVSDAEMRVVALYDRLAGIGHAVLTVRVDGTRYVLDNRSDHLFSEAKYRHYEPLLSMNEAGAWRNVQRQQPTRQLTTISSALAFR